MIGLRFDYLYFSGRILSLISFFIVSIVWLIFGFDSTVEVSIAPEFQVIGFHFSTLQTIAISFWIALSNIQVGGYSSARQLLKEFKKDTRTIITFSYIKSRIQSAKETNQIANFMYVEGFIFAFMTVLVGMFSFEVIWVPLYNYFQFGSWLFPIYTFELETLSLSFYRNMIGFTIPLFYIGILFFLQYPQIRFRLNKKAGVLLLWAISLWLIWIAMDSPVAIRGEADFPDLDPPFFITGNTTFPIQGHFPQTVYTYYNISSGQVHSREDVRAWHEDDTLVHAVNLLTKYSMFALVIYVFAIRKPEELSWESD